MEKILLGHIFPPFVIAGLFPKEDFPVPCPILLQDFLSDSFQQLPWESIPLPSKYCCQDFPSL